MDKKKLQNIVAVDVSFAVDKYVAFLSKNRTKTPQKKRALSKLLSILNGNETIDVSEVFKRL